MALAKQKNTAFAQSAGSTTRNPFRTQVKVWLEPERDEHYYILEIIEYLKNNRLFSKTFRDGIRLIYSLRQHDLSVLFELFPWIKEKFDTATQIAQLKAELAATPRHVPQAQAMTPRPKVAQSDDIDFEIKQAKSEENAGYNMMLASLGMGMAKVSDLPPEVIQYGIERGKIDKKHAPKPKPAGPKAMQVPQFEVGDIEIDLQL